MKCCVAGLAVALVAVSALGLAADARAASLRGGAPAGCQAGASGLILGSSQAADRGSDGQNTSQRYRDSIPRIGIGARDETYGLIVWTALAPRESIERTDRVAAIAKAAACLGAGPNLLVPDMRAASFCGRSKERKASTSPRLSQVCR